MTELNLLSEARMAEISPFFPCLTEFRALVTVG